MLMSTRLRYAMVLLGPLVTAVLVLLVGFVPPLLGQVPLGSVTPAFVAAAILLGLLWILVGWIFTPSVETYLGQGRSFSFPIIGPSFANPQRNPAVMEDLGRKLGADTDLGLLLAGLGFALMSIGFVAFFLPVLALAAVAVFTILVGLICFRAILTGPARPAT